MCIRDSHYAVANIPGAVARTSTIALTNVTLPYIEALAGKGFRKAINDDEGLRQGVTTCLLYTSHLKLVTEISFVKLLPSILSVI